MRPDIPLAVSEGCDDLSSIAARSVTAATSTSARISISKSGPHRRRRGALISAGFYGSAAI